MKKTSLALLAAITVFSSVAVNAEEGKAAGDAALLDSTGTLIAGGVAVGAAVAGAIAISNSSDGNPITSTGTNTTTGTGN